MNEFNTDHFWQEVYPGFYNWKTRVWENYEGTAGGASIDADVNIPIWPVLKDSEHGTYSAAKEILRQKECFPIHRKEKQFWKR